MKKVVENATPKKLTKIMKNDPILAPFSLPWGPFGRSPALIYSTEWLLFKKSDHSVE
jgi:hypothetical protein